MLGEEAAAVLPDFSGLTAREDWWIEQTGGCGLGHFPISASVGALAASLVVKSGPGTLFGFSGFNNAAGALFIQTFDAIALPADTAVPVTVLTVPGGATFAEDWGQWGRAYQRGIVICCSTTLATKTLGTASCWFDAQYV